ncbi:MULTISPECIES: YceI family protein [unclassified Bartonella]|uniref:YceI family protein n=1 Tax=unclassified Bartonella TaxID=2645622 RepID=UPI0015FE761D|nr:MULTISPECIES: YceI family protein [unclassified Bartonella]UXN02863.1 YceI family protein [Bartonella sp. HY406]
MRLIKTLATVALLAVSSSFAHAASIEAPQGNYSLDPNHTNLLWSVSHFGLSNYIARFDKIEGNLVLDPSDVSKSTLEVTVDPASVDTNHQSEPNKFNEELAGEKFFDVAQYKTITFKSTAIEVTGEKTGKVTGDLTFHGVTKPVTLDVTFNTALTPHPMTKKAALGFSAKGVIKRSEFGLSAMVPMVSDDVNLVIETEFHQQ